MAVFLSLPIFWSLTGWTLLSIVAVMSIVLWFAYKGQVAKHCSAMLQQAEQSYRVDMLVREEIIRQLTNEETAKIAPARFPAGTRVRVVGAQDGFMRNWEQLSTRAANLVGQEGTVTGVTLNSLCLRDAMLFGLHNWMVQNQVRVGRTYEEMLPVARRFLSVRCQEMGVQTLSFYNYTIAFDNPGPDPRLDLAEALLIQV